MPPRLARAVRPSPPTTAPAPRSAGRAARRAPLAGAGYALLALALAACGSTPVAPEPDPAPTIEGLVSDWSGGDAALRAHAVGAADGAPLASGTLAGDGALRLELVREAPDALLGAPAACDGAAPSPSGARVARFAVVEALDERGETAADLVQASSAEAVERGLEAPGDAYAERLWSDRAYRAEGECVSTGFGAVAFRYDLDVEAGWNVVETSYAGADSSGVPELLVRTVASSDLGWHVRPRDVR